jgi:hypothetical protein
MSHNCSEGLSVAITSLAEEATVHSQRVVADDITQVTRQCQRKRHGNGCIVTARTPCQVTRILPIILSYALRARLPPLQSARTPLERQAYTPHDAGSNRARHGDDHLDRGGGHCLHSRLRANGCSASIGGVSPEITRT